MALVAPKNQYAPHQLSSFSHNQGSYLNHSSPTASEFSVVNYDDDVRSWDERQVTEWLRTINCHKYNAVFEANNINGETLLECDQAALKELGIDKVGDRVRIFVAVKALRTKAYGNLKKRNRDTLAALDNLNTFSKPVVPEPTPITTSRPYTSSQNKRWSNFGGSNFGGSYQPDSPGDYPDRRFPGRGIISPPLASGGNNYASMPGSASTSNSSRGPMTPLGHGAAASPASSFGRHERAASNTEQIMDIDSVKRNCVKMIGHGGATRIVTINNCSNAIDVYQAALKKFSIMDNPQNYCVYVTTESGDARRLSDTDVMDMCRDPNRPERGRLIFKRHDSPPSPEERRVAMDIARDQNDKIILNREQKSNKAQQMLGMPPASPVVAKPPSMKSDKRSSVASNMSLQRGQTKKITAFFGQRPPSELISSNLAEYFPGQASGVLEKTVRNSIRRSRYASRFSVATSIASSIADAPPVPSVATAWLNHSSSVSRRSVSSRQSILGGSAYSGPDDDLSPLPEESPQVLRRPLFPDDSKSELSVIVTDTDTQSTIDGTTLHSMSPDMDSNNTSFLTAEFDDEEDEDFDDIFGDGDSIPHLTGALIGSGSFGSVYLALNSLTGALMAVKRVEMPSGSAQQEARKQSMVDALQHEISLLKEMRHQNIVQYLGFSREDSNLNIFLEYVPGGSVATMLKTYGPLQEPLIRKFVREILYGLSYLHGKDIIHRDIKGANVLVDNNGNIKISDFGISKKVDTGLLTSANHRPSLQGSVFWMAPEVVKQTSYTRKADIWSLGCLVVEMFTGTHPYPDCSQLQAIFRIGTRSAAPTIPDQSSEEGKRFLSQTFEIDHNKRPTADDLLMSPFMNPTVG